MTNILMANLNIGGSIHKNTSLSNQTTDLAIVGIDNKTLHIYDTLTRQTKRFISLKQHGQFVAGVANGQYTVLVTSTILLVNNQTGVLTSLPDFPTHRILYSLSFLSDGQTVVVIGGLPFQTIALNLTDSSPKWVSYKSMDIERAGHASARYLSGIVVVGGHSHTISNSVTSVPFFDEVTSMISIVVHVYDYH